MMKYFALVCLVFAVAVCVPGCAKVKAVGSNVTTTITPDKAPPLSAEQKTFRKSDTITADQLMPLVSRAATFRYELGDDAEETIGYYMTAAEDGAWYSTFENLTSMQLRRGEDGALLVEGVADYQRGRFIQYSPPMRLLPPSMSHNTVVVRQTRMLIRKKPDGKIKDTLDCQYKVQLLGLQRVPIGDGERDAYIVRVDRTINPGRRETTDTTWLGFEPTYGLVAQRYEKHARVLGVIKRESHWSLVYEASR